MTEVTRERALTPDVHPALLQDVSLTLRPTAGEPLTLKTKVLDIEPRPDGSARLAVVCPDGLDAREHHFDATVSWTYPLGRMECAVSTRPVRRSYGEVWLLTPTAAPTRLQQRAFFRARVAVPVVIAWPAPIDESAEGADVESAEPAEPAEPAESISLTGIVVDISEGGFLAMLRVDPPSIGTPVDITLRIDGTNLDQSGRVVRHVGFAGGGHGVGIAFDDAAVHGDRIRKLVFTTERRRLR